MWVLKPKDLSDTERAGEDFCFGMSYRSMITLSFSEVQSTFRWHSVDVIHTFKMINCVAVDFCYFAECLCKGVLVVKEELGEGGKFHRLPKYVNALLNLM